MRLPTLRLHAETLLLAASAWWLATANAAFFAGAAAAQPGSGIGFHIALGVVLLALHVLLPAPFAWGRATRPLLALLFVATAFATFFMRRYAVYLDPAMLRNVLRTDRHEAGELLSSWALVPHLLLHAGLPLLLLWRTRVVPRASIARTLAARAALVLLALAAAAAALLVEFQPMASFLRNHKAVRYLATPANYLWSLAAVAGPDLKRAARPLEPIGLDAAPGPAMAARTRPLVVVLVVGETARAADWGLAGYARQTTPELARLPVVAFNDTTACGTATEVSLPCLFAPVGRRDYDEARIRGSQSLLDVVQRAGIATFWRDNQSGCKGVCDRVPHEVLPCPDDRCWDEALLAGIDERLAAARGTQLLVLHQMGNHGPAYHRRYPPAFERYVPACRDDDLQRCGREQVVNAYDNALLYTDHVLAALIARLAAAQDRVDSAVLYVSDHGESLGEHGLWLHGLPWSIAPDEQKKVPMLLWLSPGAAAGIDMACLRARALQPASHDHVFHTLLGLLGVRTALYARGWDLAAACRR